MAGGRPPARANWPQAPQQSQQQDDQSSAAWPGPTAEQKKQQKKLHQASNAYWCTVAWRARQSQWQQALRSESVEAAWEAFWQTTLDLHDAASAGNQEVWWPGYTRSEQEMQPVKAGRSVDRADGALDQKDRAA